MSSSGKKNKKNILVTAAGGGAGINALRLLRPYEFSFNAYGTDSDPLASGQLFAKDFRPMAKFSNREQYQKDLFSMIDDWEIDHVIPTLQEELPYIEEILKGADVEVLISDKETVEVCYDKVKFYKWMDNNFSEYMTWWTTINEHSGIDAGVRFFLKPAQGRGGSGCKVVSDFDVTLRMFTANPKKFIIMSILPGQEYTVDCFIRKDGTPAYIVPRKRLQTSDGVSLKGQTVKDKRVTKATKKIIDKLDFRGPICIQWKEDDKGDLKILEINPRLSGGHMITAASGASAIDCFVLEILGLQPHKMRWKQKIVLGYRDFKVLK